MITIGGMSDAIVIKRKSGKKTKQWGNQQSNKNILCHKIYLIVAKIMVINNGQNV